MQKAPTTLKQIQLPNINGYLKANYNFNLDTNTKIKVSGTFKKKRQPKCKLQYYLVGN